MLSDVALAIHAYAQTHEQLTDELTAQVFFLWGEYALAEPESLTAGAQALQSALRSRCWEEVKHAA